MDRTLGAGPNGDHDDLRVYAGRDGLLVGFDGDVEVANVEAAVMEPGKMNKSLLGMAFLGRLQRVEMGAGRLKLVE
mgnify:CR=1 FL=1